MLISEAVYCVIDCETTGLDPETDRIVEIACVATSTTEVLGMWASLVDGRPCNAVTSAIHGLVDNDLIGAPAFRPEVSYRLWEFIGRYDSERLTSRDIAIEPTIAAHNAAFDKSFVDPDEPTHITQWLCTKRLAQQIYPTAPSSANQVLRHYLNLKVDTYGVLPHRALADCLVTAALLREELAFLPAFLEDSGKPPIETVDQLIAFADSPIILLNMPKGKHRGPVADVPTDYIEWALSPRGMTDMDRDLKYTLETELAKRRLSA
jgi:exodeoxyribonuclease X